MSDTHAIAPTTASPSIPTPTTTTTSQQQQQNEAHLQSKIQKIKEQVNNSVANNADYARTELEQVQRPLSVQSIQRQISSTPATSANSGSSSSAQKDGAESTPQNKKLDGHLSGIVNRAKEGLQQTQQPKAAAVTTTTTTTPASKQEAINKLDSFDMTIDTAQIANKILSRPLVIKDLDFTDLTQQDDVDVTAARSMAPPPPPPPMCNGIPPPPPMMGGGPPPPPPPSSRARCSPEGSASASAASAPTTRSSLCSPTQQRRMLWPCLPPARAGEETFLDGAGR